MHPARPGRVRRTGGLAAVAVCLIAASCSLDSAQGESGDGDTLRIVLPQEPPTLEPCESSLTATGVVVRSNITEPLLERDPTTGSLDPLLATAWEQTGDTEWTFTLRDDVTFSDGAAFDSAQAAFAVDRAVNSSLGCNVEGYVFGDADLVLDTPDETTLVVTTEQPDPILPLRLSFVEMVPDSTSTDEKVREPIGTGPYAVDSWDAGTRLTLARNEEYWGDAPGFDSVEYQWRSEGNVRVAMIQNDEADIATNVGPDDGAGDYGVLYPNNETVALRMQATEPPLDDIRVREAIDLAIDRTGIIESLYPDHTVAAQLVPEGVVGHNADLEPVGFDPQRAAALLDEARADGVPVDTPMRLIARTAQFPRIDELAQVVQSQLSELGLDIAIEMKDTAAHVELQQRPFPEDAGPYLHMLQHGNQAGDAAFSIDQYLRSDGFQSSYGTPAFDARIEAAEALTDEARQDALAELFATEPQEIRQYTYLSHQAALLAVADDIRYEPNSATGDEMRLGEISREG